MKTMHKLLLAAVCGPLLLANAGGCGTKESDPAAARQAAATRTSMDAADREVGYPRVVNYAQKKLLKNAYEDMDTTTLTYVYVQNISDGKFLCLGQAIGYGVSLGTQFTAGSYPQRVRVPYGTDKDSSTSDVFMIDQPEPNGLYMPSSGSATIVNLIDPRTGRARTGTSEPNLFVWPAKLPDSVVSVPCPEDVDPAKVVDARETGTVKQRD